MKFRRLAAAAGVIGVICLTVAAFAQTSGGILHADHFDSPASMSMLEESTLAANRPTMSVFNNLVMFRSTGGAEQPRIHRSRFCDAVGLERGGHRADDVFAPRGQMA
jgi:hypothetical protein